MSNVMTLNLKAGGNVLPKSFVKGDTSNNFDCLQAGAGDTPIGVTDNWTRYAPGTASDDGNQAIAEEYPNILGPGSVTPVIAGAAFAKFTFLKPDAAGKAIAVTAVTDIAGAFSLEAAAGAGEFPRVLVLPPTQGGAIPLSTVKTAANSETEALADSGKLIFVTGVSKTITLPTGVAGMKFKVLCNATAVGSGTGTIVHVPTGDTLAGDGFTPLSGKGAINTQATAVSGDWIQVECVAANAWWITGIQGTWAREA